MDYYNGFAKVEQINKPHILVYRELGYRTINIKGFDTMEALREFIEINKGNYVPIKRLEGGK